MGWASGSGLMSKIIAAIKPAIPDDATRRNVYLPIIRAFESADCDTLNECMGEDHAFDDAYCDANPTEGGYRAASEGRRKDANPYSAKSKEGRDWAMGWRDWHRENAG